MSSKKYVSLSVKLNLLIVSVILLVSSGLVWISYLAYSRKINEHFINQVEKAAQALKDEILQDFVQHFWDEINTDEFRKVREEALESGDDTLIRKWMESRPSFMSWLETSSLQDNADSSEDLSELKEYGDLSLDYDVLISDLEDCVKLFDITDAYIQHDENGITYNLVDPNEDLFYLGSIENQIDIFADYADNDYFPPTIYHSEFGWLCTTLLPLDETQDGKIPGFVGVDMDMNHVMHEQRMFLVNNGLLFLGLTAASILISLFILNRVAVRPLHQLAQATSDFAKNEEKPAKEDVIQLPIHSNDEIGDLYHQIRSMQTRIIDHMDNLTRITAERERVDTELSMAENIQRSMLPGKFPAFPDRNEFDLYASMTPAREVGGDFYDFFMPDDNHLAVLIADVSDKGVPAALFMMSSKILINYRARQGGTPAEILTDVNAQICLDNSSKMFVTVWMGILDLTSGVMTCTNAGHEYPFIRRSSGKFLMIKDKHGFIVGAMSKSKYTDYELELEPGDAVFVYTDGVPEASNSDGEFYGLKRLETALDQVSGGNPKTILEHIKADVDSFVNGAQQFDDLTMLCVEFKQRK